MSYEMSGFLVVILVVLAGTSVAIHERLKECRNTLQEIQSALEQDDEEIASDSNA